MAHADTTGDQELPAGAFSSWLLEIGSAQRHENDANVPCGECTACCTSSQFVHIAPDEGDVLARIPRALLFAAPGLPKGHVVMGYDEHGHCPMFVAGRCSIYEHRPRTCRTYDCRIFPATALELDDDDKRRIVERTRRWRFDYPTEADRTLHAAVQAAAQFLQEQARDWAAGLVPGNATQLASLALEVHDVFLDHDVETGQLRLRTPSPHLVEAAVRRVQDAAVGRGSGGRHVG
jgi:Fe-S-cluster containining protein